MEGSLKRLLSMHTGVESVKSVVVFYLESSIQSNWKDTASEVTQQGMDSLVGATMFLVVK